MTIATSPQVLRAWPSIRSRESVADYLQSWLSSRRALRASTVRSYEGHIRLHLIPAIGRIRLEDLGVEHINEMYDRLLDPADVGRRISASTVIRIHSTLMVALNAAVRSGRLERNPAAMVELPVLRKLARQVWNADELMSFLDSHVDDEMHPLFTLLAVRGMRRGEALGLKWSDVDLHSRQIRIVQQLSLDRGMATFGPPKSRAGDRIVAIDELTARALRSQEDRQQLSGRLNGWKPNDHTLVFTDDDGGHLNPTAVTRHFDRLVTRTCLPRIRLHDLRHTSASIGLASGESLFEVSRRLGHSSVALTGDIYAHVSSESAQVSAARMAQYVQARR